MFPVLFKSVVDGIVVMSDQNQDRGIDFRRRDFDASLLQPKLNGGLHLTTVSLLRMSHTLQPPDRTLERHQNKATPIAKTEGTMRNGCGPRIASRATLT